jgi:hypothetical protein
MVVGGPAVEAHFMDERSWPDGSRKRDAILGSVEHRTVPALVAASVSRSPDQYSPAEEG